MTHPMTAADFDLMECAVPGCTHEEHDGFVLAALCHPGRGFEVAYRRQAQTLVINCRVCGQRVATVAVSPGQVS